jgi:NADH:ubiquinone oxidoreductase subunit 4 (subunit M)
MVLVFLIKFPVFFLHFWLPKMHVEASTVARIILAGILLKFGVHGFSRFLFVMIFFRNFFFFFLGLIGLFFCSIICLIQRDTKSLIAYSSIFHISLVLLVYVILSLFRKLGGFLIMLSHGYVSVLSFYYVGEIFHNFGCRLIYFSGGLFFCYFFFLLCFLLVFLINSGLPFSLSFFSEVFIFLVLLKFCLFFVFLFFFIFLFFCFI